MAGRSSNYFYMILFITSALMLMSHVFAQEELIEKYGCASRMTAHCGNEIYSALFDIGTITGDCCLTLVEMNKTCHDAFVEEILDDPTIKGDRSKILANGKKIWEDCALVAANSPH
ncbi:protein DOWN-REGULATED IN DIF1 11-like [Carica papaya]|uniref:protein DOWN-REGULATED IN DIF1 11-like n=1 Tax=Carica papaya TaxID=3649 RepID=UPI000B8CF86C|nr:protein DOWN-REGULATED IN DIF1 11-like [Carica papaya]